MLTRAYLLLLYLPWEFLRQVYCTAASWVYTHSLWLSLTMVLRTMAILIRRHLAGLGLSTRFEPVAVPGGQLAPEAWDGAEAGRNWWGMDTYLLPVCVRE